MKATARKLLVFRDSWYDRQTGEERVQYVGLRVASAVDGPESRRKGFVAVLVEQPSPHARYRVLAISPDSGKDTHELGVEAGISTVPQQARSKIHRALLEPCAA
jgi:hypothetical protein